MSPEESLDPDDWETARALGHRMVDDMLDYLRDVRERPVWHHLVHGGHPLVADLEAAMNNVTRASNEGR